MAQATTNTTSGAGGRPSVSSQRPDLAAKNLMALATGFLLAGSAVLSLMLIKLAIPGFFDATPIWAYGRLRPVAFALLVIGFAGTLTQAVAYYLTPRLSGAPLRNESIATLSGYAYSALVLVGSIWTLVDGPTSGEFAEFPVAIDFLLVGAMLVPAFVVTQTVRDRTEQGMFPSLLFILGAVWWFPALYLVANISAGGGVANLLQTAAASSGFLYMAAPAAAVGASFYVVVKETDKPLFSSGLARGAFWTLAGTGLVAGPARFMAGPAPAWLETISTVMSLG